MTATCAKHPDVVALGPCERCGTFLCASCAVDKVAITCAECDLKRFSVRMHSSSRSRLGRLIFFGALAILASGGLMVLQLSAGMLEARALAIAGTLFMFGAVFVVGGLVQRARLGRVDEAERKPAVSTQYPELTEALVRTELASGHPFSVCLSCRIAFPRLVVHRCLTCNSAGDCVEVANEADSKIVLAAL